MLENDTEILQVIKAAEARRQALKCWPHSLLLVILRCQRYVRIVESAREMIRALNSQTNGRKGNRYNTFRAYINPVPPKHSFWRHLKAILKPNSA